MNCFSLRQKQSGVWSPDAACVDVRFLLMDGAVMKSAAAGLAGVFGEFPFLGPCDEFGFAIRAAHVAGGAQGHDAFVTRSRGDRGRFERHSMAFAAGHSTGGAAAGVLGSGGLAGGESQYAHGHEACGDGFDEFGFHDVVLFKC